MVKRENKGQPESEELIFAFGGEAKTEARDWSWRWGYHCTLPVPLLENYHAFLIFQVQDILLSSSMKLYCDSHANYIHYAYQSPTVLIPTTAMYTQHNYISWWLLQCAASLYIEDVLCV